MMDRRRLLIGLGAAPLAARAQATRLPLRNLLVELRLGDEAERSDGGAGLHSGAVTVDRDGRVVGRADVALAARGSDASARVLQQLRVLNGGRASIRVGATLPLQWWQWVATPQGPAVVLGSQLVDTGRGFVVQPRWPGGSAPVTVEVHSEAAAIASGGLPSRHAPDGLPLPEGSIERSDLVTTLQLPLGEWVTVASSGETAQRSERGVLSTRELAGARRSLLQMRISLP